MKINVKTLKGTHFEIEVNPQDTVMLYNTPNYYYWNKTIFLGFFLLCCNFIAVGLEEFVDGFTFV